MANKADPQLVRKLLDESRRQRTQITRGAPLPLDTAHLVGACTGCGRLGYTVLGYPDPPYAGPPGQPRYRNATELARFLDQLIQRPPPMPSPEDKQSGQCACGVPADPRDVVAVRLMHAMPGTGAELIAEGVRGGGSLLVSASGDSLGDDTFAWKLYRAPLDGVEVEIASRIDDSAIEKSFGRSLTLAQTWRRLLDAAKAGKETLEQVEPGYWIYAGPKDDTALAAQIQGVIAEGNERAGYPLASLGQHGSMPMGPAWPLWAYEHAQAISKGDLRAGVVLDRVLVRKLITAQLGRQNVAFREDPSGNVITAEAGEARWPIETMIVALGSAHLGWMLSETAAAAVGEASARVTALGAFLTALKKARPEIEFKVEGMRAFPKRKDGTMGRAINLLVTPFRVQPGSPEFEREVRFACDDIPKDADVTKLCPCGAKAFVAARLFPWTVVEEFKKATTDKAPFVANKWPEENPKVALLATISCDQHVRIPASAEIEQAGIGGEAFEKRLAEDLSNSRFAVDVSLDEDKNKKRAILAYGPLVASVVMNDHLVSALHDACGRPLRAKKVEAQVTTPNLLCLYEEGFDDDKLDKLLEAGATADGIAPGKPTPFSLTWDVSLDAAPVGRFERLHPSPEEMAAQRGARSPPGRAPAGPRN